MRNGVVSKETLMAEKGRVLNEINVCGKRLGTELLNAVRPVRPLLSSDFGFVRNLGILVGVFRLVKSVRRLMGY